MNAYFSQNRTLVARTIILVIAATVLGITIGITAYFLSIYVYYIFIYSLAVGSIASIAYSKLLQFVKIQNPMIMASVGLITGIVIELSFYGSAYFLRRYEFAIDLHRKYSYVDTQTASSLYDTILTNTTGSSGFIGYMKSYAQVFPWKSWTWLYWFLEVVIISIPIVWIGYKTVTQKAHVKTTPIKQNKNILQSLKNYPLILSLALFFIVSLISSMPVVIEQISRPEHILSRYKTWHTTLASAEKKHWDASDGHTAQYVSVMPTALGVKIILHPTELQTREGFFAQEGAITSDVFNLSMDINTPLGCHNGLIFRGNPQGEYYVFLADSSSYTIEILQREFNNDLPRKAIIPNTKTPFLVGEPKNLAVLGNGNTYYFYVNGTYIDRMRDSRLHGDRVGVEVFT